MEVDFGESWAEVAGVPRKVKYLVATLPYSNVYFAKAYPLERLESLLDGIESAFTYFGGVVDRVVLDNTSLAVKAVLPAGTRLETEAFAAFRAPIRFGPSSVRRRRAGRRAGRDGRQVCAQPGVPAAAGGGELGGAQRAAHHGAGGRPAAAPPRRRAPGARRVASWSGSICGRCPCIVPRPAASSRGWPTSSGMYGWTTSPIRCRFAMPTGRYG